MPSGVVNPKPQKYSDNDIIIKQDENRGTIIIMNKEDYVKEDMNNSLTPCSTNFQIPERTQISEISKTTVEFNERMS